MSLNRRLEDARRGYQTGNRALSASGRSPEWNALAAGEKHCGASPANLRDTAHGRLEMLAVGGGATGAPYLTGSLLKGIGG